MSWLSQQTGIDISAEKLWNDYTGVTEAQIVNEANAREAAKSREWSQKEAETARKFEEQMSNTSFQRGVKDMEKAGINPMLAYMKGGASTPSVGIPGTSQARMEAAPKSAAMQSALNSALSFARFKREMTLLEKQIPIMEAEGKIKQSNAEITEKLNTAKSKVLDVVTQTPENVKTILGGIKSVFKSWFGGSAKTNYMKERELEERIKKTFKKQK